MPNDRTAIDTITGYYYQFDYYILQLLNCSGNDEVCIEAIEDVDIRIADETTAVQCKYYAKTEYNHSVIAKPIRLMLNHFKQNTTNRDNIHYKLYGHFESGQSKLDQPISLIFLKEKFLTYTKNNVKHEHHKDLTALEQIDDILDEISSTRVIYQFFLDAPYYQNASHQMHLIKIPSTDYISNMI